GLPPTDFKSVASTVPPRPRESVLAPAVKSKQNWAAPAAPNSALVLSSGPTAPARLGRPDDRLRPRLEGWGSHRARGHGSRRRLRRLLTMRIESTSAAGLFAR